MAALPSFESVNGKSKKTLEGKVTPGKPILIITGPTGTGKSRLALHLAQEWDTEIVSADSRQIYRYMDIGTGKPTPEEQDLAPHHMIDIIDPDQSYNAGKYARSASAVIDRLLKNGKIPILAGGTGLYIRSVIEGLAPSPPTDPKVKAALRKQLEQKGIHLLHHELTQVDPLIAKKINPNDRQRILRALEVFFITGRRLSDFHQHTPSQSRYDSVFLFINRLRSVLFEMINQRVDRMFKRGLIEEVQHLLLRGYMPEHPGMQSLGYIFMHEYLQGKISLEKAKERMKRDTRRYAKRQITWFRQNKKAIWLDIPSGGDVLDLTSEIKAMMKKKTEA